MQAQTAMKSEEFSTKHSDVEPTNTELQQMLTNYRKTTRQDITEPYLVGFLKCKFPKRKVSLWSVVIGRSWQVTIEGGRSFMVFTSGRVTNGESTTL